MIPPKRFRLLQIDITPRTLFRILAILAALWFFKQIAPVLVVILGALILVGTLNPFVERLEGRNIKRPWALAIVFLACAGIIGLIAFLVFPALWGQIDQMIARMPVFQTKLADIFREHAFTRPMASMVQRFEFGKSNALNTTAGTAVAVTMHVVETLGYMGSTVVLAIYFMADHERMRGVLFALVPREFHVRLARILLNLQPIVGGYMRGQLITSIAIWVFTLALLTVFRIPGALALASFAALTDIFPFVGGLLATLPAVLASLSRGMGPATIVLAAMVAYQEFESRVLVPRIYGKVLRLPSSAVIIALLVGGKLAGILGALLALPLASALLMLMDELRVDLPGDDTDDSTERKLDEQAARAYAIQSAGASPQEAGTVATSIAEQVRPPNPNNLKKNSA